MGTAHKVSTKQWECNWVSWLRGKLQTLLKHLLKSTTIKTEHNQLLIRHLNAIYKFLLQIRFTSHKSNAISVRFVVIPKTAPCFHNFCLFSAFTSYAFYLHIYFTLLLSSSHFYSHICHIRIIKTCTFCKKILRKNLQMICDQLHDCLEKISDRYS